jgi:hypothetical protein
MRTEKSPIEGGTSSLPWRSKPVKPNIRKKVKCSLEAFQDGVAIVHDLSVDRFLRVELRKIGTAVAMSANQLLLVLLENVRTAFS